MMPSIFPPSLQSFDSTKPWPSKRNPKKAPDPFDYNLPSYRSLRPPLKIYFREAVKKNSVFYRNNSKGQGVGIPTLYVKFWWPLFLALKFMFLFLNLAEIQIFIPKSAGGGSPV